MTGEGRPCGQGNPSGLGVHPREAAWRVLRRKPHTLTGSWSCCGCANRLLRSSGHSMMEAWPGADGAGGLGVSRGQSPRKKPGARPGHLQGGAGEPGGQALGRR